MQIQMTTYYAIWILTYLAAKKTVVASTELADTVTGAMGGYVITRPLENISLYDIVCAFEGGVTMDRCLDDARLCTTYCIVHDSFHELQGMVKEKLKSETLATLLMRGKDKGSD